MTTFKRFEDIEAWQETRELVQMVYEISNQHPFCRDFDLRAQLRRAVISILSNIAEGFERGGTAEFIQFLAIAKGSAGEVRAQLYVAKDLGYVGPEAFEALMSSVLRISKRISGLISYLRRSDLKGCKYKNEE
jgi:four helix bundle protein